MELLKMLFHLKMKRQNIIYLLIFVFTLTFLPNCATGSKERKLEVEGFTLIYKAHKSSDSEIKKIPIEHPAKVSVEVMTSQLLALKYKELSLFGKRKSIFSVKDTNSIARLMAKALNRAPSGKLIYFELESLGGMTKGHLFHSRKLLHWRFSQVSGRKFNLSNRGPSGFRGKGTLWKLVPQRGQVLKKTKGVFSVTWDNWIVSKIELPMTKGLQTRKETFMKEKNESKPSEFNRRPTNNTVLEEKLNTVNGLKKKGLIDKKEYQKRKKAILDRYL